MAIFYNNQYVNGFYGTSSFGLGYFGNTQVHYGNDAASAWTPADLTQLMYWWRSDTGVTTSGSTITEWVAKYAVTSSSTLFTTFKKGYSAGSIAPNYSSSNADFNDNPSINFNGANTNLVVGQTASGQFTDFGFASTNDLVSIWILLKPTNSTGNQFYGGPGPSANSVSQFEQILTNRSSNWDVFTSPGGYKDSTYAPTTTVEMDIIESNDDGTFNFYQNNGADGSTGTLATNLAKNQLVFCLGRYAGYGTDFAPTEPISIAEYMLLKTKTSADDRTNLYNYFSARYL